MHPGQIHLKHFKYNYRFILFKAGLGSWRWKRQQSFLIHTEHSQTDTHQCINAGVSWAHKFTVLTQFHCLKENLFQDKLQFSNTEVFGWVQTLDFSNSVANPSKQGWDRGNGSSETPELMVTIAAPWDWEWGKTTTLPVISRLVVALQLLMFISAILRLINSFIVMTCTSSFSTVDTLAIYRNLPIANRNCGTQFCYEFKWKVNSLKQLDSP